MKKEIKWNYAIVRSIFGDYWVGKTKIKADEKAIFSTVKAAVNRAQDKFCNDHCYSPGGDSNDEDYDPDLDCAYNEIENDAGEEEISKQLEARIVRH